MATLSRRAASTLSASAYLLLLLSTICAVGLSSAAILSQAVRTAENRSWKSNFKAAVVGASYALVLVMSLWFCLKRRISVRLRMQRISKVHKTLGRKDLPMRVHQYISQEYVRTCLVSHESVPTDAAHEGWGRPGTRYENVRFRRALLDTIPEIDALAHLVIPTHPTIRPHARVLHHFRYILPLLSKDEDGLSVLHYYDSAIQLARTSSAEPTESEYRVGIEAASDIKRTLQECRMEMLETDSLTHYNSPLSF